MTQAQRTCSRFLKSSIILLCAFVVFGSAYSIAQAQTSDRSYKYESIYYSYSINKDSSVDARETQTYIFQGTYHAAERIIPLNKIDDITDISVVDATTGTPLIYSTEPIDKNDPASWGKYTVTLENSNYYIRWYYDLTDTTHTWIVSYKLHGAITFLKEKDEFYWNLFERYDVPIAQSKISVMLPDHSFGTKGMNVQLYASGGITGSSGIVNSRLFEFTAENIQPGQPVTIAAGWAKGIVSRASYWKYFLFQYLPYVIAILVAIGSLIIGLLHWYFTEKHNVGRGTIIPEYEPPQNLRPAMAEALVKEGISNKAWAATIVDLAVRGYVKISEESSSVWNKMVYVIPIAFFGLFLALFVIPSLVEGDFLGALIFGGFVVLIIFFRFMGGKLNLAPKDYIIERLKDPVGDPHLENYEKSFIGILGTRFSTKDMKRASKSTKSEMASAMRDLKTDLYAETDLDTRAYSVPLSHSKYIGYAFGSLFLIAWVVGFFMENIPGVTFATGIPGSYIFSGIVCFISLGFLFLYIKFNPRLSEEGAILREKWLGFKMYLETAERYRMQNLTPELFEKYLPYAIIFGVEKKWARSFESINITPPSWFVGPAYIGSTGIASSVGASSFSASAFSSSFSSSLTSSFSSAGGGASGGGGSSGGGGGGGGGGAS
ncbi:MAG: DUF2207 domain-containing protein [Patescibacteria group bacterium]